MSSQIGYGKITQHSFKIKISSAIIILGKLFSNILSIRIIVFDPALSKGYIEMINLATAI